MDQVFEFPGEMPQYVRFALLCAWKIAQVDSVCSVVPHDGAQSSLVHCLVFEEAG